jgi:hypothetical protein
LLTASPVVENHATGLADALLGEQFLNAVDPFLRVASGADDRVERSGLGFLEVGLFQSGHLSSSVPTIVVVEPSPP